MNQRRVALFRNEILKLMDGSDKKGNVKTGQKIPAFSAWDENGNVVTDGTLAGQKAIIFFYGQDDSPTCTKEACSVRDHYETFRAQGYKVYGVSKDTVKKHKKFIEKYNFPYSLIADPELSMMNAFGYYGPKMFMGKQVMGVYRTTVVIDESGTITHILDDVVSADHGKQIAEAVGL